MRWRTASRRTNQRLPQVYDFAHVTTACLGNIRTDPDGNGGRRARGESQSAGSGGQAHFSAYVSSSDGTPPAPKNEPDRQTPDCTVLLRRGLLGLTVPREVV